MVNFAIPECDSYRKDIHCQSCVLVRSYRNTVQIISVSTLLFSPTKRLEAAIVVMESVKS